MANAPLDPNLAYWYTPLAGSHYPSPLHVTGFYINGVSEEKKLVARFWRGSTKKSEVGHTWHTERFVFDHVLPPGPYNATWDLLWRDDWSNCTGIGDFYVRTPPEESPAQLPTFNTQVIDRYISGYSATEMLAPLEQHYGDVSPSQISAVIDTLKSDFQTWQVREVDEVYPMVYLERFAVSVGSPEPVEKPVYLGVGINKAGHKVTLGLWIADNTTPLAFWRRVMTELKKRGVKDILTVCAENFEGLAKATQAIYPATTVQYSIEHRVRDAVKNVPRKQQKQVAADLELIFASTDANSAEQLLRQFEKKWNADYPAIGKSLRQDWSHIEPCFAYPADIHKMVATTDRIDTLNISLKKTIETRSSFPANGNVLLLLYLNLRDTKAKRATAIMGWKVAMVHFKKQFKGRV